MRLIGTVANWNDDRGFGFVKPTDGSPDLFLHIRAFQDERERPRDGMTVSYEAVTNQEGKLRAERVVIAGQKWSRTPTVQHVGATVAGYLAVAFFAPVVFLEIAFWGMPAWVVAVYVGLSVASLLLYWQDKRASVSGGWRVRESDLHLLGLLGGWPGAVVAQNIFRHKTKKASFARFFWITVMLNVLLFAAIGAVLRFNLLDQLLSSL